MTPFRRLALFAANGAVCAGVYALGEFVSWGIAFAAVIGAAVGSIVATLELAPSGSGRASENGPSDEVGKQEVRDFTLRRRDRRDIERSAQRAADEA